MIEIHTGILRQEEIPNGAYAIDNTKDYLFARHLIEQTLESKETLQIYVRTRSCDTWFWDLPEYFGRVEIIDDAPEERLRRKLGLQSLATVSAVASSQIIELRLLDLPNPTIPVTDPLGWVLRQKLGTVWGSAEPSREHFSMLVKWFVDKTIPRELHNLVEMQAANWLHKSFGNLHSAYARLFEEPHPTALTAIVWRTLQQYEPALVENWLVNQQWYRRNALDLAELVSPTVLPSAVRRMLNPKLQTHWVTRLMESLYD